MGKVTFLPSERKQEDIPHPTSIVLGRNLRKPKQADFSDRKQLLEDIANFAGESIEEAEEMMRSPSTAKTGQNC